LPKSAVNLPHYRAAIDATVKAFNYHDLATIGA